MQVIRRPEVQGRQSGLAAYSAWADDLLRDEDAQAGAHLERGLVG